MRSKEPITAVGTTGPSSTSTFTKDFETDGVLTGVFCSTYVGHEFDLRYSFYLLRGGADSVDGAQRVNLLDPLDQAYLAGNGENHDIEVRHNFESGDQLVIEVENNDGTNTYHHQARVSVDYSGWDIQRFIQRFI